MDVDPYALLNLPANADARAVRRAFRRLAMQWHPDRNPDPDAVEQFRRLRAAHDQLLQQLAQRPPLEEAPPVRRGRDRELELHISIETACLGERRTLTVEDPVPCSQCDGSGIEELAHSRLCEACHGTGKRRREGGLFACEVCDGRGFRSRQPCTHCGGSGKQDAGRQLEITLPAGLQSGDRVRLEGQGHPAGAGETHAGDLLLTITVTEHPLYRLAGRDLVLTRPVSALQLLLGGHCTVPHPAGERALMLTPGPAQTRELRLRGEGLPARPQQAAGDLVVHLQPVFPDIGTAELQPLLKALQKIIDTDLRRHLPQVAAWEQQWLPEA